MRVAGRLAAVLTTAALPRARALRGGAGESAAMRLVVHHVGLAELAVPTARDAAITLYTPACADRLLDAYVEHEEAFGGRTPYYGVVWPAAVGLARDLGARGRVADGDAVLELGAGLGLCGIAAALTGRAARVTLVDHDPVAVELGLASAVENGVGHLVDSAQLDWTEPHRWPAHEYSLVVAADVIYEAGAAEHVAAVVRRVLRPDGRFVLADLATRPFRPRLREAMLACGFAPEGVREAERVVPTEWEGRTHDVVLSSFRRTARLGDHQEVRSLR